MSLGGLQFKAPGLAGGPTLLPAPTVGAAPTAGNTSPSATDAVPTAPVSAPNTASKSKNSAQSGTGQTWIYAKDGTNGTFCPSTKPDCGVEAHSGTPGHTDDSEKSIDNKKPGGPIPLGTYTATNCHERGSGKGYRCDLKPDPKTDSKKRDQLQLHGPSKDPKRAEEKRDTVGCIVTKNPSEVKSGDKIQVTDAPSAGKDATK